MKPAIKEIHRPWWYQPEMAVLALLVGLCYLVRLAALPIAGEEGRWARGATQMIETGDWVVLRQQGQIFPERPPMSSWAMAAAGLWRGRVDDIAVRLPSVFAVLLTCWTIFWYSKTYLSRFAALASAAVYATFGQVLQLGRMGESEALFACLVSASLLIWHHGYTARYPAWFTWTSGYALAALGALVKGPQAPVYFVMVTFFYLAVTRNWKFLVHAGHLVGGLVFVCIVGAWQIPYYLATDWDCVLATWTGLAADRFSRTGVLTHMLWYPLETLVCLLPWSPLLVIYLRREFHRTLNHYQPLVLFLTLAVLITYPSVWLATGSRGRYFMPLYPCFAILIGVVIDRVLVQQQTALLRRGRLRVLLYATVVTCVAGAGVLLVSCLPSTRLEGLRQPTTLVVALTSISVVVSCLLLWGLRSVNHRPAQLAFLSFCFFVGFCYCGPVINLQQRSWNNPRPAVRELRQNLPAADSLKSFGPVDHRFAYFYEDRITELPWPTDAAQVPEGVTYFCYNWHRGDTSQCRSSGRGRAWKTTSGTLPFEWELIANVNCGRDPVDPFRTGDRGTHCQSATDDSTLGSRCGRVTTLNFSQQ